MTMMMMMMMQLLMINLITFTSHLPPFPFAFELAVAFFQSSNQTNNRRAHRRFHRPTDGTESLAHHRQRAAQPDCLSDAVEVAFAGFGV